MGWTHFADIPFNLFRLFLSFAPFEIFGYKKKKVLNPGPGYYFLAVLYE